jgi:hypothetical protein
MRDTTKAVKRIQRSGYCDAHVVGRCDYRPCKEEGP